MKETTLHILRNTNGWNVCEVREARLDAADTIEFLQRAIKHALLAIKVGTPEYDLGDVVEMLEEALK